MSKNIKPSNNRANQQNSNKGNRGKQMNPNQGGKKK
jgi:hypothetical protein